MYHNLRSNTQDANYFLRLACLRIIRSKSGLLSFYQGHSFQIVNIPAFET